MLLMSLVGLAIVAAAVTPYWIGAEIEDEFRTQSEQFQQQLAVYPGVSFALDHYQRDYLTSTAETTFTFDPNTAGTASSSSAQPPIAPFRFTLHHQISHGPWIDARFSRETMGQVVTTLVAGDGQQALLNFYFGDQPALAMITILEWAGGIKSEGRIALYRGRDHTGQYDVKWGGLHFEIDGDWIARRGEGRFNSPRFEFSNAAHGVSVGGLSGKFSSFISPQGLALGAGDFSLDMFKVRDEGADTVSQQIVMRDMKMAYDAQQRGDVVDVMQQFGFRLLQVNGKQFNNGTLRYELSNLDAIALQLVQKRYEQLTQAQLSDPEQLQQVWLQEAQTLLPMLLQQAPEIHISKAEVTTVDGLISARLKLAIDNSLPLSTAIELPAGLQALLPLIQVELDLKLPVTIIELQARKALREKIVEQLKDTEQTMTPELLAQETGRAAEQMLAQFEIQNIIRREGGYFRTELRYSQGHLHLNGVAADNLLNMLPPLKES